MNTPKFSNKSQSPLTGRLLFSQLSNRLFGSEKLIHRKKRTERDASNGIWEGHPPPSIALPATNRNGKILWLLVCARRSYGSVVGRNECYSYYY